MDKKMLLEYFNMILFVFAVAFMLAGMVLGPFGYDKISIVLSCCAGFLFALGLLLTLLFWRKKN